MNRKKLIVVAIVFSVLLLAFVVVKVSEARSRSRVLRELADAGYLVDGGDIISLPSDLPIKNSDLAKISVTRAYAVTAGEKVKLMDDQLARLVPNRKIKHLQLRCKTIHGSGLVHLIDLPNLRILDLEGTSLSDDYVSSIAKLERLTTLRLTHTKITNEGFMHLKDASFWETIRYLDLGFTKISAVGGPSVLEQLESKELQNLNLSGLNVTNEHVDKILDGFPNLSRLSLRETNVDGQIWRVLKKYRKLESVNLLSTNISPEESKKIRRELKFVKNLDID